MQYLTTKTTFCIFFSGYTPCPKSKHNQTYTQWWFQILNFQDYFNNLIPSQTYRLFIQNHKQKTTNSLITQFVHWEEFMNLLGFLFIGFLQLVLAMCELWEKSLWTISENVYLSNSVSSNKFLKLPMQWSVHKFL